jgi:alcohol dehydrogenase (cytochrome c)
MSRADWARTVDEMVARGAQATPGDVEAIVTYLSANFGSGPAPGPALQDQAHPAPETTSHPDAAAAEEVSRGRELIQTEGCLSCHRAGGAGSFLGPDLDSSGSPRSSEQIRQALVSAGGASSARNRIVRIVTRDGARVTARMLNQDTDSVQVIDAGGRLMSLRRSELRELATADPIPMPSYAKMDSGQIDAVVAYLVSLHGAEGDRKGSEGVVALLPQAQGQARRKPDASAGVTFERLLHASREPNNWLTFNGSYQSLHYSLLDQITPANAKNLELKWVFQAHWLDSYEATPLVVDGVLYTTQGDDVVALDAATGRLFWIFRYTPPPATTLCCGRITRGLAILGNTLYLATVDAHLIAIDARTGDALWNTTVAKVSSGYSMTLAPMAIKNKILVGVAGGEYGIRGFLAAYDAQTGKEAWRFYTVAGPGDPGQNTWGGDSWKHGGGPIWLTGSYDPEVNLIYWGVGNAGPDFNGDVRPGDNLYTSSMIALDPDTGKLKWYYQANPHNEFDWDAVQVPVLADIDWQGKPRKVILWADRNGFFYVLDRVTGQFLLGRPFVEQRWNDGFDRNGRPIMAPEAKSTVEGTLIFPDVQGGTNWFSPSFSPRTSLFYVNARENSSSTFYKGQQVYQEGNDYLGLGRPATRRSRPQAGSNPAGSNDDRYTAVTALDPRTGKKKWQFKLNTGTSLHVSESWNTNAGAGGILTTASGILFTGGREGNAVVLNARTGELLWKASLGAPVIMNPIAYSVDGRQYLAIAAGNGLFVFALR